MSGGRRPRFWKEEKSGKKSHGGRPPKSDNPSPVPSLLPSFCSPFFHLCIPTEFAASSRNQVNGRTSERRTSPVPLCSGGWTERRSGAKTRICLFCGAPISSTHSAKSGGAPLLDAARKTANNERTDLEGQLTLQPGAFVSAMSACPSVQGQFPTFMLRDTEGDFAPPDSVLLAGVLTAMGKMTMTEVSFPGHGMDPTDCPRAEIAADYARNAYQKGMSVRSPQREGRRRACDLKSQLNIPAFFGLPLLFVVASSNS